MGSVSGKWIEDWWEGKREVNEENELNRLELFYRYLQGEELLDGVKCELPKLTSDKAFEVIWYLQEIAHFLPSKYERCDNCGDLYNSDAEGINCERDGKCYCGYCAFNDCNYESCEECIEDMEAHE
jgi:hypothetical protein